MADILAWKSQPTETVDFFNKKSSAADNKRVVMPNLHAEHIWINGRIETLDDGFAPATALAIGHGTILAVGSDAAVSNLSGPGTVLHDLNGRFVMPGLVESHSHALWGACRDLFDVFVGYRAGFE